MPGPNSHPKISKTKMQQMRGYNQGANQRRCDIRNGAGKFRGVCNCPKHPSK
jgi:hypothetical protein